MNNRTSLPLKPKMLDHLALAPLYVQGKHQTASNLSPVILSANENPWGPSPKTKALIQAMAGELHRYPDGSAAKLREELAKKHGLQAPQIICGNGSDELITLICRAFVEPGAEVLSSQYGFLMYEINAKLVGGVSVKAPETARKTDCDALLACLTDKTRVVFIANPNNPTGSYLDKASLAKLHQALPSHVLLVIDAAYSEYAETLAPDYDNGLELAKTKENVIMLRTFSKAYGMAGLRLGWGVGDPALIEALNRVRSVFNVSSLALAAGIAALDDVAYLQQVQDHNRRERDRLWQFWQGLAVPRKWSAEPTYGNFLLLDFGQAAIAQQIDAYLLAQNIIVRRMDGYALPSCLRVTIGASEENERFMEAIRKF